jgi:hypothetical protein
MDVVGNDCVVCRLGTPAVRRRTAGGRAREHRADDVLHLASGGLGAVIVPLHVQHDAIARFGGQQRHDRRATREEQLLRERSASRNG